MRKPLLFEICDDIQEHRQRKEEFERSISRQTEDAQNFHRDVRSVGSVLKWVGWIILGILFAAVIAGGSR